MTINFENGNMSCTHHPRQLGANNTKILSKLGVDLPIELVSDLQESHKDFLKVIKDNYEHDLTRIE